MGSSDKDCLVDDIRASFADSLNVDAALRPEYPEDNRWDYLLGHEPSRQIVGVEPHSAKSTEVGTIIRKKRNALDQLRPHLRSGVRVAKWLWVASGKIQFASTEKARLQLDQNGIEFVGRQVAAKHLPAAVSRDPKIKRRSSNKVKR